MAPVVARLHVPTIAGEQQQLLLLHARRRPAGQAHLSVVPGTGGAVVIPLVCSSGPFLIRSNGVTHRRLRCNPAAAAFPVGDDDDKPAGALGDELHKEHSGAGGGGGPPPAGPRALRRRRWWLPSVIPRRPHGCCVQKIRCKQKAEAAAVDDDADGGGQKKKKEAPAGGGEGGGKLKTSMKYSVGSPAPGNGPHYN
uniref:Uncharacterized protein n=1 Tax=Oryza brachyantha TaxID=4533 RepID=J3MQS7_ORYBR